MKIVTSFCPNCGKVQRAECHKDDATVNRVPCSLCAPLLVELIDADILEETADEEFADVISKGLPANVQRATAVLTKRDILEAQRKKRSALERLRSRRAQGNSETGFLTRRQ